MLPEDLMEDLMDLELDQLKSQSKLTKHQLFTSEVDIESYNHCQYCWDKNPYSSRSPAPMEIGQIVFSNIEWGKGVCVGQRLKTVITV